LKSCSDQLTALLCCIPAGDLGQNGLWRKCDLAGAVARRTDRAVLAYPSAQTVRTLLRFEEGHNKNCDAKSPLSSKGTRLFIALVTG